MSGRQPVRWKLWYHDRAPVAGETWMEWLAAPYRGVECLVTPSHRVGCQVDSDHFYCWPSWLEGPTGMDHWGTLDYLVREGALSPEDRLTDLSLADLARCGVKLGRTIATPEFQAIHRRASSDPEMPRKSGYERRERRPA